jgi:hypothetical protein
MYQPKALYSGAWARDTEVAPVQAEELPQRKFGEDRLASLQDDIHRVELVYFNHVLLES